jgi:hypothetical protein
MKNFAYVNPETNIVENISVADDDWSGENWIEYSSENIASIGYTYRSDIGVFISPQPYPSWTLDANAQWQSPVPLPMDGNMYIWNESNQAWEAANGS